MNYLLKANYDKLLLGLAAVAVSASCTWWWQQQGDLRRLHALPVTAQLAGSLYELVDLKLPETKAAVWPKASAQSHGKGWLYEVFTPPVIYYNTLARSFTVRPPLYQTESSAPFGLELLAVKPEQFRLQLVGYFGAPGDYRAAFTSPNLPGTLLARAGRHFENLGLTLKSFAVKKILVEHNDARLVYDVAAFAVLADEQTGAEVLLDSRARKFTDTPLAMLRPLTGGNQPRTVHEGDNFSDENSSYCIERIQLDPPEVVVTRTTPGQVRPETKVLHLTAGQTPAGQQAGTGLRSGPIQPRGPALGLATNGK